MQGGMQMRGEREEAALKWVQRRRCSLAIVMSSLLCIQR